MGTHGISPRGNHAGKFYDELFDDQEEQSDTEDEEDYDSKLIT